MIIVQVIQILKYFIYLVLYVCSPLRESTLLNLPDKDVPRVPDNHSFDASKMVMMSHVSPPTASDASAMRAASSSPNGLSASDLAAEETEKRRHNSNSSSSSSISDSSVDVKVSTACDKSMSRLALYQAAVQSSGNSRDASVLSTLGRRSASVSPSTVLCDKSKKLSSDIPEDNNKRSFAEIGDAQKGAKESDNASERSEETRTATPRDVTTADNTSSAPSSLASPVAAATASAVLSSTQNSPTQPAARKVEDNVEDSHKQSIPLSQHKSRVDEGEHYTIRHPSPSRPEGEVTVVKHSPKTPSSRDSQHPKDRRLHDSSVSKDSSRHPSESDRRRSDEKVSSDRRPTSIPSSRTPGKSEEQQHYPARSEPITSAAPSMPSSAHGMPDPAAFSEYMRMLAAGHHGMM